jgi:hypothetical protein
MKYVLITAMWMMSATVSAAVFNSSDYFIPEGPGNSWTYTAPVGTITTPLYQGGLAGVPAQIPTDTVFEESAADGIYGIFLLQGSRTVQAGTFDNVLAMISLDNNYADNSVNSEYGVTGSGAVTEIAWYALGVGLIEWQDIRSEDGLYEDQFELVSYSVSQVPVPAAAWLFGSALLGLGAIKRKKA